MDPQSSLGDRAVAVAAAIAILVGVLFGAGHEAEPAARTPQVATR